MKRFYLFLLTITLVLFLGACSDDSNEATTENENDGQTEQQEEVTITYANWNLGTEEENNIERRMIAAFEEQYPNIKIEIDESIAGDQWNESLSAAASANKMPDVFMMTDLSLALSNDWLYELNDIVEGDKDFNSVADIVLQSVTYNDQVVAIPFAQHLLGYWVNKDVFNNSNLDYPEFGVSVEEFKDAIKNVTNVNNGVVGIEMANQAVDWYPAAVNPDMGWFTFNGEGYNLNSNEFISAVNFANELETNNYTYNSLSDEQKTNFSSDQPHEVWLNGEMAVKWDGTWAATNLSENASFEFDFIGLPGGRVAITNDILGISKTTEHPEEAYLFAKWMSFGKDGYMKRMEIANEMGIVLNSLPISTDQEILDEYFASMDIPGILKSYQNLDNAIVEPFKTVPGYIESRFTGVTGVKVADSENATIDQLINAFIKGELKVEDYAVQLNDMANNSYQEASQALE